MTMPAGSGRMDYTGNGNTPTYSYNFKIFNKNHLKVITRDTDNVEDTLDVDIDYTVSGVGNAGGGSITLTAGNLASNYHLTIREVVPIEQATDLRNQGDEYREVQEDALDYSIKVSRQQQDEIDRSFKLSETITGVSAELPIPEALKFFRWNSLATALENISLANLATIAVGNTLKLVDNQLDISAATSGMLTTNGDDHNHSGGDGAQIDHTTLSNKGTNTHAALDTEYALTVTHRADTSNPHSVDKTDVGLSNVTNDAQVKVTDIGTTVLAPTGDGSGLTGIGHSILNKTADYPLVAADLTGRTTITNAGAGASSVTATLLAGAANYVVHFNHIDSGNLVIDPNGTEVLYVDGVSLGAGVALTSAKKGARYTCIWNSSGGWWEVNYFNTSVKNETVLAADVSTTSVYATYVAVSGMTVTIICGVSGKVTVAVASSNLVDTNYTFLRYMKIYRDSLDNDTKSFGVMNASANATNIHQQGGFALYTGLTPGTSYVFGIQWCTQGGTLQCLAGSVPTQYFMRISAETN